MKKSKDKIQEEIIFYIKKLPPVKQMEALDFIKWLWVSKKPAEDYGGRFEKLLGKIWDKAKKNPVKEEEINKIVEKVRAERYAKGSC